MFYPESIEAMYFDMISQYFLNKTLTILRYVEFEKTCICTEHYFALKIATCSYQQTEDSDLCGILCLIRWGLNLLF